LLEISAGSLRSSLDRLVAVSEEYVSAVAEFAYTSFGPTGTIRSDLAMGTTLAELKEIEKRFKLGFENMQSYVSYASMTRSQ
jgi:hypothetical protein